MNQDLDHYKINDILSADARNNPAKQKFLSQQFSEAGDMRDSNIAMANSHAYDNKELDLAKNSGLKSPGSFNIVDVAKPKKITRSIGEINPQEDINNM